MSCFLRGRYSPSALVARRLPLQSIKLIQLRNTEREGQSFADILWKGIFLRALPGIEAALTLPGLSGSIEKRDETKCEMGETKPFFDEMRASVFDGLSFMFF